MRDDPPALPTTDLPAPQPKAEPATPVDRGSPDGRLRRAPVQVRPSPLGGRGVFAAKPIRDGALLEECPVLVTSDDCDDFCDHVIGWGEPEEKSIGLPLGYGALYNHSDNPNAYWDTDSERRLMIIWAARDIAADEEILISYGPTWFQSRDLQPAQQASPKPQ